MRISRTALLWTLLGAGSYCLSFPQWDIYQLTPLALLGYLFALDHIRNVKQSILAGVIASFVIGVGGFHWIVFVARNFGMLPLPLAVLTLLAFCLIAAPQVFTFFLLGNLLRPRIVSQLPKTAIPFFWALLYISLEYLFNLLKIFPEYLGNPWIGMLSIAQSAALGGPSLLSFLPALLGAALYGLVRWKKKATAAAVASLALFIGLHFWGLSELRYWEKAEANAVDRLKIAIAQASIGDMEKVGAEMGRREALDFVIHRYLDLSKEAAARGADLVVWPETAYPLFFPIPESIYNAAAVLDKNANVLGTYRKSELLIFGEYMPFASIFPALKKLNPNLGDFHHGAGPYPLKVQIKPNRPSVGLGANICYEAIMPGYMRELARNGSTFFLNITNDSWFGPTAEPWQHLQLAQLRAIENRIPMVRATNTGISAFISATGRVSSQSALFKAQLLIDEVPIIPSTSFYVRNGDIFAWASLLITIFLILAAFSILRFLPKRR